MRRKFFPPSAMLEPPSPTTSDGHAHTSAHVEHAGRPHEQATAPQAKKLDRNSEVEHGTG